MKLAGAAQSELIKIAAVALVGVAALWMIRKGATNATEVVSEALDKLTELPGRALDAVKEAAAGAATAAKEVAAAPFQPTPEPWTGAGLPTGWFTVTSPAGEVLTQYPRRLTLTKLDQYMMVDP